MSRPRLPRSFALLGVAALLGLSLFAFVPLGAVLLSAFEGGAAALVAELTHPASRLAWRNTVLLSTAVTSAAVILGALLAWLLERTDVFASEGSRRAAVAFFALPLAVPPYLLAMAWALLGNGRNGLLNRLTEAPWIDLYGLDGIVFVLTSSAYPFALLAVRAALERADPSLEEAARIAGAGPWGVLREVTLPLVTPALAAAAGLVFVFATAAFGVPYLLGSVAEPPVAVLTTRIFQYTTLGGPELLGRAAALALVLLATSLLAQLGLGALGRGRSVVQVGGKSARPALLRLGRAKPWVRAALFAFAALVILTPLATIVWTSLQASFADPFVLDTRHWASVLGRAETTRAFVHSALLALGAGAIVAVLGLLLARVSQLLGRRGTLLEAAASAPYAVPGTVLAIGLILTFSAEWRLVLFDRVTVALYLPGTLWLLLVAYAVKHLAFGVRGAKAALLQLHPSLEEAARICGAGPLRATGDVIVPLVRPAVGASFLLVALPCLSELTMSVLLFGAGTETAGTLLFELQSYASPPAAAVVATLVVLVAVSGDLLSRRLQRKVMR